MAKFTLRERVTIVREITVDSKSIVEVQKNYENGDYDEELKACYFDGKHDDVNYTIESEDGCYSIQERN